MTHEPRTKEEIYESLRNSLKGQIAKLRNFTQNSFNYLWTQAHAEEVQELEAKALVAELAGWIDYTGKELNDDDLEDLGIKGSVDPEQLNKFMDEDYLDQYVKIVGITRFEGSKATGTVTIRTQSDQTTIPKGTVVTTTPDNNGNTLAFETTEKAETSSGVTSVSDVSIEAQEVGSEYNVPADEIVRFEEPPLGVRGVTNPASTTGGENRESNEELRARAKDAVQTSSLGGTTDGIKGYIRQNVEGVGQGDIIIDEFTNNTPPFVDVIVDGGLDADVRDAIAFSRPTGIEHNLVRPQIIQLGWDLDVLGTDIDTASVISDIEDYLLNQGIGDDFYEDDFIRMVMESDDDIINIDKLGGYIERVTNETFTYQSGTSDYRLDFTYEDTNGSITVEDSDGKNYSQGSDFEIRDQTGDGWPETLVWIGTTPDDGQQFFVDYDVTVPGSTNKDNYYVTRQVRDEIFTWNLGQQDSFDFNNSKNLYELTYVPFDGSSSVTDNSGDTYSEGVDYEIVDDSGNGFKQTVDWSDINLDGAVADDGGTTTDETAAANDDTADDMTLLPSSPATGDAYYFGFNQTFDDIRIDISTAGAGTWSIVWEYYNGTSWTALSGVTDGTNDFRNSGINEVSWTVPGDWSTTSVGGISGLYWVRARLDTFSSISTQPLGRRADQDAEPDGDESFTVTYDQKLYETEYEIEETPIGEIDDDTGDTYQEDTDYQLVDYSGDDELDAIEWLSNPAGLSDGDEFYFAYFTEGDRHIADREKVDPGTVDVTQV